MQLLNTVQNEAIVSNVAEIGEFRIRNSAKAFNILSSGLYANKIKAIIRELSCNAVDSHAAAGKQDTPFDVHLPTQLEPWFAIRDYGTGLTHDQVTNIYTTYFESTKTDSNDYIGALGLGSKSPFSYTDNFTVTAIKDGVKGIYSAFINDAGVPSIALMATEETTDPAGVEVKFSVNDRWDFDKFFYEARAVYKWFKLRPVMAGDAVFEFEDVTYKEKDVIPGVHINSNYRRSIAIMGNIAYPIEIPSGQDLGNVGQLLDCSLVMEFAIGELDFQASREGLSYIPQTVAAIKRKLEAVNAVLATNVATEADAIPNMWDRASFLVKKADIQLYRAAVAEYIGSTNFSFATVESGYIRHASFKFTPDDLQKHYNIAITAFEKNRGNPVCSKLRTYRDWTTNDSYWDIPVSLGTHFVVNDTKIGACERAKHHWRNGGVKYDISANHRVFVIEAADKTKPVKVAKFLKAIGKPVEDRVLQASSLLVKARAGSSGGNGMAKDVTILKLEKKGYGGYHSQDTRVWRDAGKIDKFDSKETYYYLPISGFKILTKTSAASGNDYWKMVNHAGLPDMPYTIYGVRKTDIEAIKLQANWINLEDYLTQHVANLTDADIASSLFKYIDFPRSMRYNDDIVNAIDPNGLYAKAVTEIKNSHRHDNGDRHYLAKLLREFGSTLDLEAIMSKYRNTIQEVTEKYPLLQYIGGAGETAIADYINLVDQSKGI